MGRRDVYASSISTPYLSDPRNFVSCNPIAIAEVYSHRA